MRKDEFKHHLETSHTHPITQSRESDIFVAGYPKSGNTWMQHLITGVLFGIDAQYLPDRLAQEVVPDIHFKSYYKRFRDTCIFKTHETPQPRYRRVIHLVRDGRDVMASYFAYNQKMGKDLTMRAMILDEEGLFPCSWEEHTMEWIDNPHEADLIRVHYEDMHRDPMTEMERICQFIGIDRDKELLRRVIEGCALEKMQEKSDTYGMENDEWPDDERFFRRGVVGGYKDEIPDELIATFEQKAGSALERLGYHR